MNAIRRLVATIQNRVTRLHWPDGETVHVRGPIGGCCPELCIRVPRLGPNDSITITRGGYSASISGHRERTKVHIDTTDHIDLDLPRGSAGAA